MPASNLGINDEDTGLIGSKVRIEADRLTLDSPGEKSETLLTAECQLLPEQRADEKQRPLPGKEAAATLSGKVTGTVGSFGRPLRPATSLTPDPPKTKGCMESWAGGGAGQMGRTPSLLAFYGDGCQILRAESGPVKGLNGRAVAVLHDALSRNRPVTIWLHPIR